MIIPCGLPFPREGTLEIHVSAYATCYLHVLLLYRRRESVLVVTTQDSEPRRITPLPSHGKVDFK